MRQREGGVFDKILGADKEFAPAWEFWGWVNLALIFG
jgi:hypothetical protein